MGPLLLPWNLLVEFFPHLLELCLRQDVTPLPAVTELSKNFKCAVPGTKKFLFEKVLPVAEAELWLSPYRCNAAEDGKL